PIFGEGKFAVPGAWSPDGTKLVAIDLRSNSDSSIHVIDLETGEAPEVTPHDEEGLYLPGPWRADGSGFYLLTDEGREVKGIAFCDVAAGRWEGVETPDNAVEEIAASHDGRVLAGLLNEDGYARLRLRDMETGRDLPTPDLPDGARPHLTGLVPPIALSADASRAAARLPAPRRPPHLLGVPAASPSSPAGPRRSAPAR